MLTAAELAALHADGYMTVQEAAELLRRPPQTIYRWARDGIVGTHRVRGAIYVYGWDALNQHIGRARRLTKVEALR